ncbi:ATP-binding cassette domain-containing protein [Streptomyces sp. NPDC089919]|uniref:ABC transporter ATP-binding protein/permease n=1 Tax=Streptomyces sp. NPDC089919 TaxID=3155188 RepID=UPI003414C0E1
MVPLIGILVRTEWGELGAHLTTPGSVEALKLSLLVSFWALGLSVLLGVPLAWLLARVDFHGKALERSLVLLPMVLPPTVGGVALLLGFGRRGLLGPFLDDAFGITLPFHTSGTVVAATFVAMTVLVALRGRWTGGHAVRGIHHAAPADDPVVLDPERDERALPAPEGRWALHAEVTGFNRLTLEAEPGTTIAVVGENGAGKTTLLRALLGLTPRAHADLRLGGDDVTAMPPHRRGVAWVPQDGALFPHLTAPGNTAYGLRAQGVARAEAREAARVWLDRLGVGHLAGRRPAQLSGGQAQRVALARALAARPRLLLLDEPLAALDQTTRARVRHTLRTHLAGFGGVCLIVTHDPVEAVSLADRVLVLSDGRALQYASPADVTRNPRSPWVARMLGRNAWPGTTTADGVKLAAGGAVVVAEPCPEGSDALAIVAPEAVSLHREQPAGSPRNVWSGTVREVTAAGSRLRVLVSSPAVADVVAEITPQAAAELGIADGTAVWCSVKATEITVVTL